MQLSPKLHQRTRRFEPHRYHSSIRRPHLRTILPGDVAPLAADLLRRKKQRRIQQNTHTSLDGVQCKSAHPRPTAGRPASGSPITARGGVPLPPQPDLCDEQKMRRDRRDRACDKHSCESQREYRIRYLTELILMSRGIISKALAELFEQARAKFCNLPEPKLRRIVE